MNQGIENILRSKVFQGAKCVKEQSVLRSKVFQGAKCVKKQSVLRSKGFQGVKCSLKQSVRQPMDRSYDNLTNLMKYAL